MARHLTDNDINNIVEILDSWPTESKLSWDRLVDAVASEYRYSTTRQTLQKQVRIKKAFDEVKKLLSGNLSNKKKSVPPSLKIAADRLEKKEREIARLKSENQALLEQFQVWLYNANKHEITIEQLSEPISRS
ncbi:hypothetical protein [Colwellia sp. RSH04]|uniref:hypothetical protein n=1 Tax=Colwellia sp. RSH04 TaxID=2305464 RepID=UPI000E58FDF5|nr:hypothetical protein [Colwellia sp. RSH04]RHW77811.1 hypothetical protein D1094_02480 [Colwellia sp. RSH04]